MRKMFIFFLAVVMLVTGCSGNSINGLNNNETSVIDYLKGEQSVAKVSLDFPYYDNAEGFLEASKIVVVGHVLEINNEIIEISGGRSFPYHILSIGIDNVIKGEPQKVIKVRVLGGEKDGDIYISEDLSDITIGDTCFFGLDFDNSSDYMWPVNYIQGVQVIDKDIKEVTIGSDTIEY